MIRVEKKGESIDMAREEGPGQKKNAIQNEKQPRHHYIHVHSFACVYVCPKPMKNKRNSPESPRNQHVAWPIIYLKYFSPTKNIEFLSENIQA